MYTNRGKKQLKHVKAFTIDVQRMGCHFIYTRFPNPHVMRDKPANLVKYERLTHRWDIYIDQLAKLASISAPGGGGGGGG